jgi:pseudouridine synthase
MQIRLQKYLADAGIASRRASEAMITAGRIFVNGKVANVLGTKIDPEYDKVTVDGKSIKENREIVVMMLNKPRGYVVSARKFPGEKNIFDLIDYKYRIYPIGRLDKDSEGLLLLTNDGALADRLTHPKFQKEKEYIVSVDKNIDERFLAAMENGVNLDDGRTKPALTEPIAEDEFSIILREGRKRQIRRMCTTLGFEVTRLKRIRVNDLMLGNLKVGQYRILGGKELGLLE